MRLTSRLCVDRKSETVSFSHALNTVSTHSLLYKLDVMLDLHTQTNMLHVSLSVPSSYVCSIMVDTAKYDNDDEAISSKGWNHLGFLLTYWLAALLCL